MNPLVEIIKAFTSFWLWTVVLAITAAFMWALNDALSKPLNRDQLDRLLDGRRYAVLYQALLQTTLARIDRWLTPTIGPSPETREAEGRRAWSWPLLDFSLRLALAYPLLTLIVSWGVLGTDGKLGSLMMLPAAGWGVRIGTLAGLVIAYWLICRKVRAETKNMRYWQVACLALAFAFALIFVVMGVVAIYFTVLFAAAELVASAGAVAVAFAFAISIVIAVAITVAGAVAMAITVAFSVTISFAITMTDAGTGALAGFGGGAVVFLVPSLVLLLLPLVSLSRQ